MLMANQPLVVGLPERIKAPGRIEVGLVGRSNEMAELTSLLTFPAYGVALPQLPTVTLHGQGGIGKTALAVEFAQTHQGRYQLVWWVNADAEVAVTASFRALIRACGEVPDEDRLVDQVNAILTRQPRWLAVFDNVVDKAFFDQWRPTANGGQMLITSRVTAGWINLLEVGRVEPKAALAWLLEAAGSPTDVRELEAGQALLIWLDGLALGLAMACGFIAANRVSLANYKRLYEANSVKLLNDQYIELPAYNRTIYTALAIDRTRLRTNNADAAILLLEYASFCAPDRIPLAMFPPSSLGVTTEVEVLQARRALAELSLVAIEDENTFSVHRLTQDVMRFLLDHPPSNQPAEDATGMPVTQTDSDSESRPVAASAQTISSGSGNVQIANASNVTISQAKDDSGPRERNPRTEWASWIVSIIVGAIAIGGVIVAVLPTVRSWSTGSHQADRPGVEDGLVVDVLPSISGPISIVSDAKASECMYAGANSEPVVVVLAQTTRVVGLRMSFTGGVAAESFLTIGLDQRQPVKYPVGPLTAGQFQTFVLEATWAKTINVKASTGLCHLQVNP